MRVTVNADDFGKDENATKAIVESFAKGYINQTTLMTNMPWADKAVELARKNGFADKVGLHLNLTEGRPLTEAMAGCNVFCNESGEFRGRHSTREEVAREEVRTVLLSEIEAQIVRYLDYGLKLGHCDGHHHVQTRLHIAKVLMPILAQYGFRSIRRPNNIYLGNGPHIRSRIHQVAFAHLAKKCGLSVTDYFSGWVGGLERIVNSRTLEIMVHPRYDHDGILSDVTDFGNDKGRHMCEIKFIDGDEK